MMRSDLPMKTTSSLYLSSKMATTGKPTKAKLLSPLNSRAKINHQLFGSIAFKNPPIYITIA
ncbi:hypothetical protein [Moraxella lacunata]|uniref:hypothetical protein n=1 Tax=Moraxella lacunata TaxID=477 RepID=UPI003EDE9D08